MGFELYCQLLKQSVSALKGEKVKPRVEVDVHLDFLALSPEESRQSSQSASSEKPASVKPKVTLRRDVATYVSEDKPAFAPSPAPIRKAPAYIPLDYIREAPHRIEIHRKLAQTGDMTSLRALREELRDRFGPLPPGVELLLKVRELKIMASERGVSAIETKEGKLMLTRNNDYIMGGGKFPRLTRKEPVARLNEIRRLLQAI